MTPALLLAISCAVLVAVVAVQDHLVKPLQQESISAGLTGPYHVFLDAAFLLLSIALVLAFRHGSLWQQWLAYGSAGALVLTGITGTLTTWVDTFTAGKGELWHTRFTAVTFVLAILLQLVSNTGVLWIVTALGIAVAATTHFLVATASVTEKVGVLGLCAWLIAWSLT